MIKVSYIGLSKMIQRIDVRGHNGRVFYCTDVHGCFDLLHEKLREVAFNSDIDILLIGGDIADRGVGSIYVLDYLNTDWIFQIRGNHEEMFMGAVDEGFEGVATNMLLSNGGVWVAEMHEQEINEIYNAFQRMPYAIELITDHEKIGIVHAQCPFNDWDKLIGMTIDEIRDDGVAALQWARTNYYHNPDVIIKGVDRLMVGHTPTRSGEIEIAGNTWYCDLGSFYRDKLALVELTGGVV